MHTASSASARTWRPVGLGIDHHGLDAQLAAGALDAQGDLAAVGDQNLLEHPLAPRFVIR
jgi:hypothetical protein